ncbi:MAG: lysophospholipid acyltransferase family protein [Oscillospiraceae bacterium]|nr:lysophospholipid acyltransferase family protein [Oscillospiraceae bacterium]
MDNQTPAAPVKKPLPLSRKKPYVFNWDRPIKRHPITYMWSIPVADHIVLKSRFEDRVYTGADNVPKEGGFLLCSNHVNGFDPITITVGFRGRREMYFMAKEEFYQAFYTRWALNIWNGFPVNRGKADRDSINYAVRVLKAGFGLLVFPQGTRDLLGERPSGFKHGAAVIAREAGVPVLPTAVYKIQEPGHKKATIHVRYGKPITNKELGFSEGRRKAKEVRAATQLIQERVAQLWDLEDQAYKETHSI